MKIKGNQKSILPGTIAITLFVGLIVCTGAGAGAPPAPVTAYFANDTGSLPVYVDISSTATTTGRVTSSQTGCVDNTMPCPKAKKVKINCPQSPGPSDVCTAYFPAGSKVALKANPGDSVFAGWSYMGLAFAEDYNLGVDKTITVRAIGHTATAYFEPHGTTYNLSVGTTAVGANAPGARIVSNPPGIDCNGDNSGTCTHPFPAGTYVTLTAPHVTGTELLGWNQNYPYSAKSCSKPGPCKVPMSEDQSVGAFIANQNIPLPVTVAISTTATTTGRVTSAQAGCVDTTMPCPKAKKVKINCPRVLGPSDVCTAYFPAGSKVTLKANPGDSVFAGWFYTGLPVAESYNFGIDKSITVRAIGNTATAYFEPHGTTYNLSVGTTAVGANAPGARIVSNPSGIDCHGDSSGTCSHAFPAGTYVTLNAEHETGIEPLGWNMYWPLYRDLCGKPGPCKVPVCSYLLGF